MAQEPWASINGPFVLRNAPLGIKVHVWLDGEKEGRLYLSRGKVQWYAAYKKGGHPTWQGSWPSFAKKMAKQ